MRLFLCITLFLLYFTSISLALTEHHRCIFDEIQRKQGKPQVAFVRELPGKERSGLQGLTAAIPGWDPIRFKLFTSDMDIKSKYCSAAGQIRPDFTGDSVVCTSEDVLTPAKKSSIVTQVLPSAIKMHTDRLFVQRVKGNIVVPGYAGDVCGLFTIPASHQTTGVSDADMILYAAAAPTPESVIAWATTCSEFSSGRPAIGMMNFGPKYVSTSGYTVRVATHEIAHSLGFSYPQMNSLGMVSTLANVRGKASVSVISSTSSLRKAREHYNCPSAPGIELEDEGGPGTAQSHWERRNAKDELMAGIAGVGYYSSLTLSAFEDMGFYRANFDMAEPMGWGLNSGCGLLTDKCVVNGVSSFPDMFCDESSGSRLSCTSDLRSLGSCDIITYDGSLPVEYQYFTNPTISGSSAGLTDLCPYIQEYINTGCADGQQSIMPGSYIGASSRCMKGNSLIYNGRAVDDICVKVSCVAGELSVRFTGDDNWVMCPAGSTLTPGGNFQGGSIICPTYEAACTAIDNDGSMNGLSDVSVFDSVYIHCGFMVIAALAILFA